VPCGGQGFASGEALEACDAIHAEVNAVAHASDTRRLDTIYVTTAPCISCTKLLLATPCKRIVFRNNYAASGEDLWRRAGRDWVCY
jgi:dCMP deaminase